MKAEPVYLYIHNDGLQYLDVCASIHDVDQRRVTIIPPGVQGRLSFSDQVTCDAAIAFYTGRGITTRSSPVTGVPVVEIGAQPYVSIEAQKQAQRKARTAE